MVTVVLVGSAATYLALPSGSPTTQELQPTMASEMSSTNSTVTTQSDATINQTVSTQAAGTTFRLGNSSALSAVDGNEARKVFQAFGLTWVFYTDGTNMVYQTFSNSSSSVPVVVGPETIGWHFSVWYDQPSNTVYYVATNASNFLVPQTDQTQGDCQTGYLPGDIISTSNATTIAATDECLVSGFSYGWGTPSAGGTIDWNVTQGFVQTGTFATNPYIYGNGTQVWVSLQTNSGASLEVWLFDHGSWNRVDEISTALGSTNEILPLQSGIALIYAVGGLHITPRFSEMSITITTDDGASWSGPVSTVTNSAWQNALSVGNTIYIVGIDNATQVIFWSYTMGASAFTPARVLASDYIWPFLSTDGNSSLVITYIDNNSVYIRTSTNLGATWSPQTLVATSPAGVVPPAVIPFYFASSTVPVCWVTGVGPYQLQCSVAGA